MIHKETVVDGIEPTKHGNVGECGFFFAYL